MAAPQGGMVPKGLAQGQQGGELMGKSWKEHAVQKLEEKDGKGWKRMEKDGKGWKRMEKDGKGWKRMEKDGKGWKRKKYERIPK